MIADLLEDFAMCLEAMPSTHASRHVMSLLYKSLRRDAWFIERHPTALFQCGWNACWWHGYAREAESLAGNGPAAVASGAMLRQLMERWRARKQQATPGFPWLRSLRPPPEPLGSGLLFKALGHRHFATRVAFSPDGRLLASGSGWYGGSDDWVIRLWKAEDGLPVMKLEGHGGWINGVAFCPTGEMIVSSSEDGTIRVWDVATGRERHRVLFRPAAPSALAFLPDGCHIAIGMGDGNIEIWEAKTWRVSMRLSGHADEVDQLVCSARGNHLASRSRDGKVKLWRCDTGVELSLQALQDVSSHGIALSGDGRTLVTGAADGTIHVRNASTAEERLRWCGHSGVVHCLDLSPDGRTIASSSTDLTVRLWDSDTGRELACFRGHGSRVEDVRFAPNGSVVASASQDHSVRVWEVGAAEATPSHEGIEADIAVITFSPEGIVLATGSDDGMVRVWDASTGHVLASLPGHAEGVAAVVFLSHARLLTGSADGTVRLWNWPQEAEVACWSWPEARIKSVAVASDGNQAAVGMEDGRVFTWDMQTGHVSRSLITPEGPASESDEPDDPEWPLPTGYPVTSLVFSSDGRHLFGAGRHVWRWDLEAEGRGATVIKGDRREFGRISLTADGEHLLVEDSAEPTKTLVVAANASDVVSSSVDSEVGNPSTASGSPARWRPAAVYEDGISKETVVLRPGDDAVAFWLPAGGFVNHWAFSDDGVTFAYALMGYRSGGGHHLFIMRFEGGSPRDFDGPE
jgi:WD40 repeat protein